jgi:UDP-glucose 4-epimerase
MRVVVTGATGNVGTSVLRALGELPEVEAIVGVATRLPERQQAETHRVDKATFVAADVSRADLAPVMQGADAVIHLAWRFQPTHDPPELLRTNVEGSRRVFDAAVRAGVPALLHASSLGVYAPGPKGKPVDETWPATGVPTSRYSRHKVEVERLLDDLEQRERGLRVVRFRPVPIFKREAAAHIHRLLLGPLVPRFAFDRRVTRLLPVPEDLAIQCVHTSDVADAFARAVVRDVRGAFNLTAGPPLDAGALGAALGAGRWRVSGDSLRRLVDMSWKLRLQPTDVGWIDLAYLVPFIDAERARRELDWTPRVGANEALAELLGGLRDGAGLATPATKPRGRSERAAPTLDQTANP